ncbi:MAG: hypothetical protein IPK50_12100 [Fibrobacterota bacterium]|nr:hypothetical protein [Fibrobacterota bacterium]QQS03055.1 MAG: hypothetical protein IPK50_12100 [Fibrobacterota bacterium]
MSQPKPQARPEGTTIQADGKKSLNDYATTFYHNATLGAALGSVQQKLSVTDPTKPLPKGTTLFIPGMLVGQGQPKSGGVLIDAAYRRTGAVVMVEDPKHPNTFLEGPSPKATSPLLVRQWVNERSSHCGMDHKGWVRNVWITPAGCLKTDGVTWGVAAVLTVRVRFTPHPDLKVRSERTDPPWGVIPRTDFQMTPAGSLPVDNASTMRSGVDNEKKYQGTLLSVPCSSRPGEYLITKQLNPGDAPFILSLLFGIGGGDRCEVEVTTGDPKKEFQSKVIFENWRALHYEIVAPDSMLTPYLEAGTRQGKQFAKPIRDFVDSNLESLFILFKQSGYTQINLNPSQVGVVPGESLGIARPLGFVASDETINMLPCAKTSSMRSNFLQIFLADVMFDYSSNSAQSTAVFTTNQTSKTIIAKDLGGKLIFFPPSILTSKLPNKKMGDQSIDFAKSSWKTEIANPSKYLTKPTATWKAVEHNIPSYAINDGTWLVRLLDVRTNGSAPMLDNAKKSIELPLSFERSEPRLSAKSLAAFNAFIANFAKKDNLRLGKFNFEVNFLKAESIEQSIYDDPRLLRYDKTCIMKRFQHLSDIINSSPALNTPIYTHPGLDQNGKPLLGSLNAEIIQIRSYKSFEYCFPTSQIGNPLQPGDFLGTTETPETCKISASFPITRASLLEGGYKKGTRFIECSAYLQSTVPAQKWPEIQQNFGIKILHEIGHAIGMTPFTNSYYAAVGTIPGIQTPSNIDGFNPDGSKGTYYANNNTPGTNGRDGIRNGHEGSHCASGLSNTFLSSATLARPQLPESPNCLMFGEIHSATSFCSICRKVILNRCIDDVQTPWQNRA